MSLTLFKHQNMALPIMKAMERNGKGGFLADGMGLGKSVTMATFLMRNKIPGLTDLIVCPLSLMKHWKKEIKRVYKADDRKRPKIFFFHGRNRLKRLKARKSKTDFVITTYAILGIGQLRKYRFGRVVLDESHYIKNGLTKKGVKCAIGAYEVGARSRYNWCITGTPFNNCMKDIASQCKFIGTAPYNDPKWWIDENGGKNQKELDKWRNMFVLRRIKDKVLKGVLKPPKYHDIEIEPTEPEQTLINKIREKAKKKFDNWKRSEGLTKVRLQGQLLALIQRLRVVSNSYYCGEKNIDTNKVMRNNAKVHAMTNMLHKRLIKDSSHSVVIFSQFTSYLDVLSKVIKKHLVGVEVIKFTGSMNSTEREKAVKKFTTSKHHRVMLISLLAGGCGLTLIPSSTVFLSEPYYNPFMEKQAEERVHRIGQKNKVHVFRFCMKNSVETWINGLKQKKLYLASALDLVSDSKNVPTEFCFDDLRDLFIDLVGFSYDGEHLREPEKKGPIEKTGLDCSICLEDTGIRKACNLKCGHIYHVSCLEEWSNIKDACPECRRPINLF